MARQSEAFNSPEERLFLRTVEVYPAPKWSGLKSTAFIFLAAAGVWGVVCVAVPVVLRLLDWLSYGAR